MKEPVMFRAACVDILQRVVPSSATALDVREVAGFPCDQFPACQSSLSAKSRRDFMLAPIAVALECGGPQLLHAGGIEPAWAWFGAA
jgi:hypothetical protein